MGPCVGPEVDVETEAAVAGIHRAAGEGVAVDRIQILEINTLRNVIIQAWSSIINT